MAQASDLQDKLLPSYLATVKTIKGAVQPLLALLLLTLLLVSLFLLTHPLSSLFVFSSPLLSPSYSLAFLLSLSLSLPLSLLPSPLFSAFL